MARLSIPIATLPQIRHLLSAVTSQQSSGELWCNPGQRSNFFHGSAWGIAEAVRMLLQNRKKSRGIVFLPDYFCNQALMPLRLQPVQLIFYPVTENLDPDWYLMDDLVLQHGYPDMFILVHYFGFPSKLKEALHFCKQAGAELLEDGAHVLMPFDDIGKQSWATVFSPYKLLPVPKMGILVTSEIIENNREISEKKKWIDMDSCKWIGKRLLQSFLTECKIPWKSEKIPPFELDIEEEYKENSSLSIMPLRLLTVLEPELEHFKKIRRKNYKIMEEAISFCPDSAHPLFSSLPENVCPYLFPLRLDNKIIGDVYYSLNRIGIPAQTWPDLPPEVKGNPSRHRTAIKLRKTLLTIPVHQNLTTHHIDCMAQCLRSSILEALNNK